MPNVFYLKMRKWLKKIIIATCAVLLLVCAIVFFCDYIISKQAEPYIYNSINDVPHYKVGLLLGTSKYLGSGVLNPFFERRISAAVLLMKKKKIKYIIASGDNRKATYNEPERMKEELVKRGVPEERIFLDYAGLRTLDSVVRCQKIFKQDTFLVISQKFHNERAIFIARNLGINTFGFNAKSVPIRDAPRTTTREYFARVKAVIDVFITDKAPRFLGEEIDIP